MKEYKKNNIINMGVWLSLLVVVTLCYSCRDKLLDRRTETKTVTFNSMGGTPVPDQSVFIGTTIRKPEIPKKELAFFAGWYQEEQLIHAFSYSTLISADITLYAKWTPAVVVRYDTNGGTEIKNDTIPIGETAITPAEPSKNNSVFIGWYADAELTKEYSFFATPVNENITLFAKWIDGVTLSFRTNSSAEVQSIGVMPGTVVSAPIDPVIPDSTFMGWFADEDLQIPFDFNRPITENTVVYAKWFQNIYSLQVYPATGNPQYYLINGLKPEFRNTPALYIPTNVGGVPVARINSNAFLNNKIITDVYMEDKITHVLANAFDGCSNIITIRMPATLVSIGNYAFRNCSSLKGTLQIPNNITGWGGTSFSGCTGLERVILPINYGVLPSSSFSGCSALKELFVPAMRRDAITNELIPITLANVAALANTHPNLEIYVPAVLVDKYKTAPNWSVYAARIKPIP